MAHTHSHRGFITLISILIITAVGVAIVIGIILSAVSSSKISLDAEGALHARSYANACAEEALRYIREDGVGVSTASGDDNHSGSLQFDPVGDTTGTCTYAIDDGGNENRTIDATGMFAEFKRRVETDISTIRPSIILDSWQEVP
jgi:hypothetical protein